VIEGGGMNKRKWGLIKYRLKCMLVPGYKKRSDMAWDKFKDIVSNTTVGRAAFRDACIEVLGEDPNDW